jgi:hypothetical protein
LDPSEISKDLQSFLGSLNYHRDYDHKLRDITAPLYDLSKQKGVLHWLPIHLQAFQDAKDWLYSGMALQQIHPNLPFVVTTDASNIGWGGWIGQQHTDGIHMNLCVSGKWSESQTRWDAHRKERRSIFNTFGKFRSFLLGQTFHLRTDNKPLSDSVTNLPYDTLVHRWLDEILEFTFTVEHISGSDNAIADLLSRNPTNDDFSQDQQQQQQHISSILATTTSSLNKLKLKIPCVEKR